MAELLTMNAFDRVRLDFGQSHAWLETGVLVLCIGAAWLVCRSLGRGRPHASVWFGQRIVDGVLFPVMALAWASAARLAFSLAGQPVFVLRLAVPVLVSLVVIRLCARVLAVVFPNSRAMRAIERIVSWVAWLVAVLWIVGLLPAVLAQLDAVTLPFGKGNVSLRTVFEGLLSCGLVLVAALWISSAFEKRVLDSAVADLSLRKIAVNATRAALLLIGLLVALSSVGVDLTALSVLGGAVGLGLGFGLQKLAANYVSGFVILLERSLRIGDNVKVDSFEGRITDIRTRYTLVRAGNGREAIVPNELLITQRVENLSMSDLKFNITTNIVVGYDSDVAQVQRILCRAAVEQPRVMKDPAPDAFLVGFAPDGLEFSLHFWVADPANGQLNVRSAINIAVLEGLRAAGVDIPFPQRTVVLKRDAEPPPPKPADGALSGR